jgi:hypothetical protein
MKKKSEKDSLCCSKITHLEYNFVSKFVFVVINQTKNGQKNEKSSLLFSKKQSFFGVKKSMPKPL